MSHPSEEDLVLHHFGEPESPEVAAHLQECVACRAALESLGRDLAALPVPEPPVRGDDYGAEVWARLAPRLAARPSRWTRVGMPLAMAASLVLAFLLGRHWPGAPAPVASPAAVAAAGGRDRILLVAIGDHLERSEMLLVELANAGDDGGKVDISTEQQLAADLAGANRLYRQAAARSPEPGVASVLDELERFLVEVAHRPSAVGPAELAALRRRIESRGLLFRVRVIETQVRAKEKEATKGQAVQDKVVS